MITCYLGLGSNLRSPQRQLRQALLKLRQLPRTQIIHTSHLYFSRPLGLHAQPCYYNLVTEILTTLPPLQLLQHCQTIERQQQRIRKKRWGGRTLDIDILLYGQQRVQLSQLTIPHREMLYRDFVLTPLIEIAPTIQLPNGQTIMDSLETCEKYLIQYT